MQNNRQQVVPVFFLIGMISACSSDLAVVKDPAQVAAPPSAAALEIDNAVIAEIFPKDGLSNDTCGLPDFSEQVIRQVNEIRSQARYCGTEYFEAAPSLVWQDAYGMLLICTLYRWRMPMSCHILALIHGN